MKKVVLAVCLALSFAMPSVYAQSVAPVDPAATAAVKELLVAMNYRATMINTIAQMQQNMPAMMLQGATAAINGNPKLTPEQKSAAIAKAAKEIPGRAAKLASVFNDPALLDELVVEMVPVYARHFTIDELHQMAQFYQTPVGVKMMNEMPAVVGETMAISQRVMIPRMNALLDKVLKDQ